MNIVTVGELQTPLPGVAVTANPRYYEADILALKGQLGIKDITQITRNYIGDGVNVRAIIGINSSDKPMDETNDAAVLPCPPYCGKQNTLPNKNNNPFGVGLIDFNHAQILITS